MDPCAECWAPVESLSMAKRSLHGLSMFFIIICCWEFIAKQSVHYSDNSEAEKRSKVSFEGKQDLNIFKS